MRIALTSTGKTLDAPMDIRFGRCSYFLIVDSETMAIEVIENKKRVLGSNVGMEVVRLIKRKNVSAVLTVNCGPNAFALLIAEGITIFTGCDGRGRDCLDCFLANRLEPATSANAPRHYGLGLYPTKSKSAT